MNTFLEITNEIHGGQGWELGKVLWSPEGSAWNGIMQKPKPGDLVFHSVKESNFGNTHHIVGISFVSDYVSVTKEEPSEPGRWANYHSYLKVNLRNFVKLPQPVFLNDFYQAKDTELKALVPQKSFYTEKNNEFKTAQKYLAEVSTSLYEQLTDFISNQVGIEWDDLIEDDGTAQIKSTSRVGDNEVIITGGSQNPERVVVTTNRIIRDTSLVKNLKAKYNNRCIICGKQLSKGNGDFYSEGHHIQPLGGIHSGPDIANNILILCPNHHFEFDTGSIAIEPETLKIKHINSSDIFDDMNLSYDLDNPDDYKKYLEYHYNNIYKGNDKTH